VKIKFNQCRRQYFFGVQPRLLSGMGQKPNFNMFMLGQLMGAYIKLAILRFTKLNQVENF
jgi:hypothetical protein